jgi:hypothetical protein
MVAPRVPPTTIIREDPLIKRLRPPPMKIAMSTRPKAEIIPKIVAMSTGPSPNKIAVFFGCNQSNLCAILKEWPVAASGQRLIVREKYAIISVGFMIRQ